MINEVSYEEGGYKISIEYETGGLIWSMWLWGPGKTLYIKVDRSGNIRIDVYGNGSYWGSAVWYKDKLMPLLWFMLRRTLEDYIKQYGVYATIQAILDELRAIFTDALSM